ncbi:hypothetical protein MHEI_38780 [Mycobacterium heidelbergense]|nr:hypothetical protein MHEI_38780 [Mycobacterium heidelbergense]
MPAAPQDLVAFPPSRHQAMQADRKAHLTIDPYLRGAHYYLTWCAARPDEHPFTRAARNARSPTYGIPAPLADKQEIDHNPFPGPPLHPRSIRRWRHAASITNCG